MLRDLRPYICTYKDCRDGDQQYDTFKQWVSHEERSHRTAWQCAEHTGMNFYSESEWREHIKDYHGGDAKASQSFIIEQKPNDVTGTRQCPICPEVKATNEHVAIHLQQLALFALPKSTGLEDDTGSINQDSAAMNVASGQSHLDDLEKLSFSDTEAHDAKPQMYGVDFNNVGNYLEELDYHQLPADKWVEGESWHAIFNPNTPRGEDIELAWQADQQDVVLCVAYSYSGQYMAIATKSATIVHESQSAEEISRFDHQLPAGLLIIDPVRAVCFDLEEKLLVVGAEDKLVRVSYQPFA